MDVTLDFERPVVDLRRRIDGLRQVQADQRVDLSASIRSLEEQAELLQRQIFQGLTPWQRTQLSRHPRRPYTLDYVAGWLQDWTELHGDRAGQDDQAIVTGVGSFGGRRVALIGHQKGRNTKENMLRNFGMARPAGYRKALRVMELANRFGLPILTLIDTPGAYPGVDAEAQGQSEAIARNLLEMATFGVPMVSCVIGEGGSGGALAIGMGNRVVMLEHAVYSVISPEGCAAILWNDRAQASRAAEALKITAQDCLALSVVDEVVEEAPGGAHRNPEATVAALGAAVERQLAALDGLDADAVRDDRYRRFRRLGALAPPNG